MEEPRLEASAGLNERVALALGWRKCSASSTWWERPGEHIGQELPDFSGDDVEAFRWLIPYLHSNTKHFKIDGGTFDSDIGCEWDLGVGKWGNPCEGTFALVLCAAVLGVVGAG